MIISKCELKEKETNFTHLLKKHFHIPKPKNSRIEKTESGDSIYNGNEPNYERQDLIEIYLTQ